MTDVDPLVPALEAITVKATVKVGYEGDLVEV